MITCVVDNAMAQHASQTRGALILGREFMDMSPGGKLTGGHCIQRVASIGLSFLMFAAIGIGICGQRERQPSDKCADIIV